MNVSDKFNKRSIKVSAVSYIVFACGTGRAIGRRLYEDIRNDRLYQHESESVYLRRSVRGVQTLSETDDQERHSDQSRNCKSLNQSVAVLTGCVDEFQQLQFSSLLQ